MDLLQDQELIGVAGLWEQRLVLAINTRGFVESEGRCLGEKVLCLWNQGIDVEIFPKDPFKSVVAWLVGGGK